MPTINADGYPFYLRFTIILLGVILLTFVLAELSSVLIPLAFSVLMAVLLNPVAMKLERLKLPRGIAIALAVICGFAIFLAVGYFFVTQIVSFSDELPALKEKSATLFHNFRQWVASDIGVNMKKQDDMIQNAQKTIGGSVGAMAGSLLEGFGVVVIMPVYIFLLLYYKELILNFLFEIFEKDNYKQVGEVLRESKGAVQNYMIGLLLEAAIVAALNTTALLVLGIKYALLLGVVGAVLNMLPYIGGIIAIALPIAVATITKDGFKSQLLIVVLYLVIQFIDNHFLVPYVVSSKVKINALVSIIVVLLGGMLWGVAGMFLSIPIVGVLKIIFDRIPEMHPWGKLLGDNVYGKKQLTPARTGRKSKPSV